MNNTNTQAGGAQQTETRAGGPMLVIDSASKHWEAILEAKIQAARRARWEYRVVETYLYLDTARLDEMGAEGWELAAVLSQELPVRYVFKRRVTE